MGFLVQDGLVQMGDAPPMGDVELEELGKFFGGLARIGIAPGAERSEQISVSYQTPYSRASCR